jgi:hypothetical protein
VNQEQRERLAGIAARMRQDGRLVSPPGRWLLNYAAEIEACIAEPAEAQPTPANWRCADSYNCRATCPHKHEHKKGRYCEVECRGFVCKPVAAKDAPQPAPTVEAHP